MTHASLIQKVVAHANGPTKLADALDLHYQEVQRWVRRGYASPLHINRLRDHLPRGVSLRGLWEEVTKARAATKASSDVGGR